MDTDLQATWRIGRLHFAFKLLGHCSRILLRLHACESDIGQMKSQHLHAYHLKKAFHNAIYMDYALPMVVPCTERAMQEYVLDL